MHQIAAAPPLDQDARQVGAGIAVEERFPGIADKGLGQGQLHPVVLRIIGAVLPHEEALFLAQAHGEQVPHRGLFQVGGHLGGQVLRKGVHQAFVQ